MKQYRLANIITGWVVFLIASVVYLMTIEPTASFWDCGEFISSAFKLEVGHPPGAPFFMIVGNLFTKFASDVTQVAKMVNALSALASALTILFLFWTITHFVKKFILKAGAELTLGETITVIGSGLVGALAYTFSDTFWFSAVEGEVYASSSLFTAVVFWAILKWENEADQQYANRWIIFIAYLVGLSIGVHLLNLLAIPAIVMVYYFKNYQTSRNGVIISVVVSAILLAAIMYGIIPGLVEMASKFELFFVNTIGLSYNSGVLIFIALLLAALVLSLYYTNIEHENHTIVSATFTIAFFLTGIPLILGNFFIALVIAGIIYFVVYQFGKNQHALLNTIILGFTVIIIGYSSFSMIFIRSLADPPMDQNNPETLFQLLSYLNREQYGDRPLFYGQCYSAPIVDSEDGNPTYTQEDGKYVITGHKLEYKYDERFLTLFPRMYSREESHIEAYESWASIKGSKVRVQSRDGEETLIKPTMGENIRFFLRYQVGYMYLRYFMWNFAGRLNDIQGHYKEEITKGSWISGIKFIDEARLGSMDNLPESLKSNKAQNKYYLLPLILGLAGAYFHYKKNKKDFWIVLLLFFFTGLAIVIYLNQTPYQPRERDYAYAGSFYAFAIWIGIGVAAVTDLLKKKIPATASASIATLLCTVAVPVVMANENWDDHDRSGRYTARDFAYNYLNSCAPNAILFTNGDNDTFPLWYAQEVEGVRTDVRVINLSYLGADWYIEQMHRKAYDSDPVPFTLTPDKYRQGTRDIVYMIDQIKQPINLKEAIDFVASDNPKTKTLPNGTELEYFPSKHFFIPYDSAKLIENGTVPARLADKIKPVSWSVSQNYVAKNHLMVLDLLGTNNWERPIYFAITVSSDNYLNLEDYFTVHGLAYRVTPVYSTESVMGQRGFIDTETMYDNVINKFKWGNIEDPNVYLDENNLRMLSNFRNSFARLADALIVEGKNDSAKVVLDKCMDLMPHERVPFNYFMLQITEAYYKINEIEKANEITKQLSEVAQDELDYYLNLPMKYNNVFDYEKRLNLHILQELQRMTRTYNQEELSNELSEVFQSLMVQLQMSSPQVQQ